MTTKNELTEETLKSEWFAHNEWQQHHPTMPAHRLFAKALERGFELGQKSTKTTDTPSELITGEELLDQFNSQPSDISRYVTLTEFIDRELQKAYELGQKGRSWKVEWNSPERPPQVSEFNNATFWISVESKHTGETHVYDAVYMNYPLILDDDEEPLGDCLCTGDGDAVEMVGWANKIYHPDFADYYELIQFSDQCILKGWAEYKTPESPGE